MHKIERAFKEFFEEYSNIEEFYIAYSGGVDSQILLHVAHKFVPEKLFAYHVNHGISDNAEFWQDFCFNHANALNIPFKVAKFNLKDERSGLEEKARNLRYAKFAEKINTSKKALLTGHHMDDQAETFLLHLMRGAGIDGLSGISKERNFSEGFILRPLLDFTKEEILEYAIEHSLEWVEDESNKDTKYDRNFIRNEVMPLLKTRWNKASKMISVAADNCQKASKELSNKYIPMFENSYNSENNTLNIEKLKSHTKNEQEQIIRLWFKENNFQSPDRKLMGAIIENLVYADSKNGHIEKKDFSIKRYKDNIYFILNELDCLYNIEIEDSETFSFLVDFNNLVITSRKGGETIKVNGQTKKVKNLLQTLDIPNWEKDRIPFIYYNDILISVGGIFNNEEYTTNKKGKIIKLIK